MQGTVTGVELDSQREAPAGTAAGDRAAMSAPAMPGVAAGQGQGDVRVLLLLSDNFLRPRSRQHWAGFEAMMAHPVHVDPYIGVFIELLRDPRFSTKAVDVSALYVAEGPTGIVPALTTAAAVAPDYVVLNIGNQPFCLARSHLAALRRAWPKACFIFITTDEAIDFRKVTWCYADQADLIISMDGWIGWGSGYRDRWCFLHLVSQRLYQIDEATGPEPRPTQIGMFGRPKGDRFAVINHLRDSGIDVDTNIEDATRWQMLDDRDYVRRLRRSTFALVPLRMHNRGGHHLIGRLYEALFAGGVPVVEDCEILRPFDRVCGPFLCYRTAGDVERIVSDTDRAAAWTRMAAEERLIEKAAAFGREAFFDMLAARLGAAAMRERLGAAPLADAVAAVLPRPKLGLGRLYRERLKWLGRALKRGRVADALAEIGALAGLFKAYLGYR